MAPEALESETVLPVPTAAVIRDELHQLVLADLLGPLGGEFEEFSNENPTDRYILGRLAPHGTVIEPDVQDETADTDNADLGEDQPEPSAPNIVSLSPSALGCTVYASGDTAELTVRAEWAWHRRAIPETETEASLVWQRVPVRGSAAVALSEGELPAVGVHPEHPQVVLRGRARRHDGNWLVSLFLVNGQPRRDTSADMAWLFQVCLTLTGPDRTPVFLPRPDTTSGGDHADRAEQRRLAMAYRMSPEFAVGHGTGVHCTAAPDNPMRAVEIATTPVPTYEVPFTAAPDPGIDTDLPWLADVVLDMKRLTECELRELLDGLRPLVTGYREWTDQQETRISDPAAYLDAYGPDAAGALAAARRAADRIEQGIDLLGRDEEALAAFRFANRAMYLQRIHTLAADARGRNTTLALSDALAAADEPKNRSWRPFQLAFLLLNLPALADPAHPDRSDSSSALADLLWFPTGGGKTEAYLGLTAFVLAIRRLQPTMGGLDAEGGVAVLMRYTLRLLTIQQFQRATALICACEHIRRDDAATWGNTPFRIGMWVGARVTPNRTDDADDWLKQQKGPAGRRPGHRVRRTSWSHAHGVAPGWSLDVTSASIRSRDGRSSPARIRSASSEPAPAARDCRLWSSTRRSTG